MAENKKSVLLYCDIIHTVDTLTNEEAGKLFKHYLRYINDLNPEAEDRLTSLLFEPIKQNLKRDLKKWESKSVKNKEIAIAGWEKRKNANASERIKPYANDADKVKVIVTDIVTDKDIINIPFADFWNLYDKKIGAKEKCIAKWNKLSDAEREKIISTLPQFIKSISEKKFQPHPETYLNQKRWNDEIDLKSITENKKSVTFYTELGKTTSLKTDSEIEAMKLNSYFTIESIN